MITNTGPTITIDGKNYQLTQPGQADWDYWVAEKRAEYINSCKSTAASDAEMRVIRAEAMEQWIPDLAAWFSQAAGIARLLYRLLRAEHPEIDLNTIYQWIMSGKITTDVRRAIDEAITAGNPTMKGDGGPEAGN